MLFVAEPGIIASWSGELAETRNKDCQTKQGIVMGCENYPLMQLILPYKISCIRGSFHMPLLSLAEIRMIGTKKNLVKPYLQSKLL